MASTSPFKQYSRGKRQATLDADFTSGMMFTNGVVNDGFAKVLYNFEFSSANQSLIPRSGFHTEEIIFPDMTYTSTDGYEGDGVSIKDAKDCIEEGVHFRQFILGKEGKIWAVTSQKNADYVEVDLEQDGFNVGLGQSLTTEAHECKYYTTDLTEIHGSKLESDAHTSFPVGTFGFGNSYYFFGSNDGTSGMFRTVFSPFNYKYSFEEVVPKSITAAEAVTYGYNMLSATPYTFSDFVGGSSVIQFNGILPYADEEHTVLMMTPKKNQTVNLRCYYDAPPNTYQIVWEWREVTASDWNELKRDNIVFSNTEHPVLAYNGFKPSAKDIMIRVSAFLVDGTLISDYAEKAMTVGFDFSQETYGNTTNLEQKNYDLTTATGMTAWNGRVVIWGVLEDPTILFLSDMNEPSYFPYPNNISVFDEPVITALEFMGNLVVFTSSKIYQVTLEDNGNSWKSTVLQSNLSINTWDKHLIQAVRNMLFFKSGNYYYMLVPKAQSLTGELTIAPITSNITHLFDHFLSNVSTILNEVYNYEYDYSIVSYFNYLDYEDVHNSYILRRKELGTSLDGYIHFNIIYNVVSRHWRIAVYDAPNIFYPYKHDATQRSTLASTFRINVELEDEGNLPISRRILQLYTFDERFIEDFYIPQYIATDTGEHTKFSFVYDPSLEPIIIEDGNTLVFPNVGDVSKEDAEVDAPFRLISKISNGVMTTSNTDDDYYHGFYKQTVIEKLKVLKDTIDDYAIFKNWQFLDTGYRNDNLHLNKRYRELQIQLNNIDEKDMQFKLDYYLDGSPRSIKQKFDPEQYIDEMDSEWGTVYLDSVPYMDVALDDIDLSNLFSIRQELTPQVTLWKIRTAISGKGTAPRVTLVSRNHKRYELLGINWIYRLMNMR